MIERVFSFTAGDTAGDDDEVEIVWDTPHRKLKVRVLVVSTWVLPLYYIIVQCIGTINQRELNKNEECGNHQLKNERLSLILFYY